MIAIMTLYFVFLFFSFFSSTHRMTADAHEWRPESVSEKKKKGRDARLRQSSARWVDLRNKK